MKELLDRPEALIIGIVLLIIGLGIIGANISDIQNNTNTIVTAFNTGDWGDPTINSVSGSLALLGAFIILMSVIRRIRNTAESSDRV